MPKISQCSENPIALVYIKKVPPWYAVLREAWRIKAYKDLFFHIITLDPQKVTYP